jgi:hypothetical protein
MIDLDKDTIGFYEGRGLTAVLKAIAVGEAILAGWTGGFLGFSAC